MSRLGFKSVIFDAETFVGDVEVFPSNNQKFQFPNNEIRIKYFTPPSERCPPLSILQTISPFAVRCKLESKALTEQSPLYRLHASCFRELKTAVVLLGDEELHLVAMPTKQEKLTCFWCCSVPLGLYMSCLGMLNLRCLAIVFDLDETLIVANTMKSFEDRIEALQRRLACETDSLRIAGMKAELKRYLEDKSLLKQYAEGDFVMDNGNSFKVQPEEVPPLSNNHERVIRPVIRLQEKNIVLTRINPEIRDTSVLVRLRPAWEDLKSYLTAKGRKRFEVYVCTMAERDYALEIWRLLDPEAHLISLKQLLERIVCVKSGLRKSLLNVFQDGICHSKMAMVIDDRLKVWEDKDQPRVHVVPAFTPYYAPQAETANAVPVLCVARNVACNVRGGFFKEFDENLLRRIYELCYEDDASSLPIPPDVSNYLMSEDAGFVPNGNRDASISEGINGAEVDRRVNRPDEKYILDSAAGFISNNPELTPEMPQLPVTISPNIINPAASRPIPPLQRHGLPGAPAKREVNPVELDPDMRRRLLILQHGQDMRDHSSGDPSFQSRLPAQVLLPSTLSSGSWSGEDNNMGPPNNRARQSLLYNASESSTSHGTSSHASQVKSEEASFGNERQKQNLSQSKNSSFSEDDENHASTNSKDVQTEGGKVISLSSSISIGVLQEIGRRCGSKVEFKSTVSISKDLPFSVEVLFAGEKIGVGMGKTKKEAQQQASEDALHNLADEYKDNAAPDSGAVDKDLDKLSLKSENGFLWEIVDPELKEQHKEEALPNAGISEAPEDVHGGSRSMISNQAQKRSNSPSSSQAILTKRSKEELVHGLQGLS
ncbi:RNA polymerase II C-terminal domain phosphatase-like 2 isoform X2 [Macadamia integrifolia]|uniref:RNA polymerase II C-terminal domain phosphatase-like 2 isoform X2 n=1 Tax=Macadamia integrifolia TaxID=60698 RepID=UPI001C52E194|nr:RNA polymerase II C-terminal domain phosphatase-like 2 isoform X2 [Macadamia integrifolia]